MNTNNSLSSQAYDIIKAKIMRGEVAPGQIISISGLAEELAISRTPITLACQRLEYEKFLTVAPKQGVVIKTISIDDAREIYELRAAIESYVAARAFAKFTAKDIAYLKESTYRQREACNQADAFAFMSEDTVFHKFLLSKHENAHISSILNNIYDRAFLIGLKSCQNPVRMDESIREHSALIAALKSGDKQKFVEAVEFNIINGYTNITRSSL